MSQEGYGFDCKDWRARKTWIQIREGKGAGRYSLSAREWSGFRMPFALSFCRRVPAVNCLTRYTDKE